MENSRIIPEKITHPFQLMAAWFVMLVLLVSALLAGAANITTPVWVPGFLAISSVVLALVVMFAVFLMLTQFRPNLQGPQEYAEWLKDERKYRGQEVSKVQVNVSDQSITADEPEALEGPHLDDLQFFKQIVTHPVEVVCMYESENVVSRLQRLGFRAKVYSAHGLHELNDQSDHEAVWIGSRVPPRVVLLALKAVLQIWPHLKYIHLSSDSDGPDYTHDQLFFGGSTSTAQSFELRPWTKEQIESIQDGIDMQSFHGLIRTRYGNHGDVD